MKISKPEYNVFIAENVFIPMRDKTKLASDIYFPANYLNKPNKEFPTILYRTSYDKSRINFKKAANYFCTRGYSVVIQDLRGRGKSEGTGEYYHIYNVKEGKDGFDTIEWIARQPWSSRKIGTAGSSHGGIVQSALAVENPPHLSAMFISQSASNPFHSGIRHNGVLELRYAGHIMLHAILSQEAEKDIKCDEKLKV